MAAACRLPRKYWYPRYRRGGSGAEMAIGIGVALAAIAAVTHPHAAAGAVSHAKAATLSPGRVSPAAAEAVAYARAQLGKPYLWGGTGPDAYDCSGLVMMAYRAAGISIARTSQQQWATERHVHSPAAGDLVFYPGADGTWNSPGHVALVVDATHMIEAYGTGYPIRQVPMRPGYAGFTDPGAGA